MWLIEFFKKTSGIRKIFGRKEIEIIIKQLEGISLSQSEKNRLSRDIRPKLRVISELSKFRDDFDLKKDSENIKLIDKTANLILKDELRNRIIAILLFGSHVKGEVTKRSDIDIAVIFTEISLSEATKFRIRISKELPDKVDIQVFNVLPQKIKREIARNHKIIYNNNFDNMVFTIKYLKDYDYFIRIKKIFGINAWQK